MGRSQVVAALQLVRFLSIGKGRHAHGTTLLPGDSSWAVCSAISFCDMIH